MNLAEQLLMRADDAERPLLTDLGDRTHSYAWTAAVSRALAGRLREAGLRQGDRVVIIIPNSIEYIVAYYAVLIAGGVAVPLAASATEEFGSRVRGICDPVLGLAADDRTAELLRACGIEPQRVELGSLARSSSGTALARTSPADIAHIVFTSGTTGLAKGVALSHGAIEANTAGIVEYLQLGERDRVGVVLDFVYSYGNSLLHTHTRVGGSLALLGPMTFAKRVVERLAATACTGFAGVPSTFAMLLRHGALENQALPQLRYLTCAGGALPPENIHRLRAALPQSDLFLMYGQTEASARLSYLPPAEVGRRPGSIGRGMPGVRLHVLRPDGSPAAPGEEGEIVAEGPNLMSGYWNDPAGTTEALRDGRLWTGDLAVSDEEGFLYITGRRSDLIKTAAYRVHPKEIEEQIVSMPGVHECAVVGVPDAMLGEALVACFTTRPAPSLGEIRRHLRDHLPDYKWPHHVVSVDAFPRTISGKVRRQELSAIAFRQLRGENAGRQ